ncbi:acyltransferase [Micromonospora sp. WMMD1076]|uniref:acyltransferase family protein n=1 Tax=Micromonospora sp. WMMD1076 TaxID=3016103 RepID=UPI002499F697|nr:acyltransferase [Micromonospora sp. WMMD1076]WFF04690.1 acyltransferase [Micromonospora sp. WMMD1076]
MRRVRVLAERTPAGRERYVDFLRALAIGLVVLGHWTVTVITYDGSGNLTGFSALVDLRWARPVTWLFQVIPVFFLVGGFANAASLTSSRSRGQTATQWLLDRSGRLVRPTTVLLLVLATGSLVGRLAGGDAAEIRTVVGFATIPLWFLSAYIAVVALTPVMHSLHRRAGFVVPLTLLALVAVGDAGRLSGHGPLSGGNFLFGWLAIHQIGFAWYDSYAADRPGSTTGGERLRGLLGRRMPMGRRSAVLFLLSGSAALVLLTIAGPYPVSMITVPGERLDNSSPPSLALLALATVQLGLILLCRRPAERLLRRPRPWRVVVAVNAVVLTVFLWHLSAVVVLAGALNLAHWLPPSSVGTGAWWAWRVPWLLALTVILAGLVAIFGPIEARAGRRSGDRRPGRAGGRLTPTHRTVLTAVGYACLVAGLLINSMVRMSAPEPLGLPPAALAAYLAGAGVLRLLRSSPGRPAPSA